MRNMGGFLKYLFYIGVLMIIGMLVIIGVGILYMYIGFVGFVFKDVIIEIVYVV